MIIALKQREGILNRDTNGMTGQPQPLQASDFLQCFYHFVKLQNMAHTHK